MWLVLELHCLISIYRTEALALWKALQYAPSSGKLLLLSNRLSIIQVLAAVDHKSPKVILYLHATLAQTILFWSYRSHLGVRTYRDSVQWNGGCTRPSSYKSSGKVNLPWRYHSLSQEVEYRKRLRRVVNKRLHWRFSASHKEKLEIPKSQAPPSKEGASK